MNIFKKIGNFIFDTVQVIVFSVSIFLFLYLLVFQPHKIKGDSMQPNFPNGEYLLTEKISYRFGEPQRGDVVVFKAPVTKDDEYIKRIIGLPGETVSLRSGKFYINGQVLNESYLAPTLYTSGGNFLHEGASVIVPQGEYFTTGDNRPYSSDSRAWGFVPFENITGKAWIVYWPASQAGKVPQVSY